MTRSTFYYHLKRLRSPEKYKDIKDKISAIFHRNKGRYGYRRITLELQKEYPSINHKTIRRLMTELGLRCEVRKVRYRSYKGGTGKTAPNILDRQFKAERPYQKVATDVPRRLIIYLNHYYSYIQLHSSYIINIQCSKMFLFIHISERQRFTNK